MRPLLQKTRNVILDALFPPLCYACRTPLGTNKKELCICEQCAASLVAEPSLHCSECASRIPLSNETATKNYRPPCHPAALPLLSAAPYGNPAVRGLLGTLKYDCIENAIRPIASLLIAPLAEYLLAEQHGLEIESVSLVPIALAKRKEHSRGFNQSTLIAHALTSLLAARGISARVVFLLVRTRNTKSQTTLEDHRARAENVKDCFTVNKNETEKLNTNETIVLVDDVFTTGATMHEAARVLRAAGLHRLIGLALAKA